MKKITLYCDSCGEETEENHFNRPVQLEVPNTNLSIFVRLGERELLDVHEEQIAIAYHSKVTCEHMCKLCFVKHLSMLGLPTPDE